MENDEFGAASSDQLSVARSTSEYALGTCSGYLLAVWRTEISIEGVEHWGRLLRDLQTTHERGRAAGLTFVETTCRFPATPAVTQASVDLLQRYGDVLAGFAMIYSAGGFANAGLRGQVTSVLTSSKREIPYLVTATAVSATAWLTARVGDTSSGLRESLVAAVEQLRSAPINRGRTTG